MNKKLSLLVILLFLVAMSGTKEKVNKVNGSNLIYIMFDGSVFGTNRIQQSGNVYTFLDDINGSILVERDNVVINGNGHVLHGTGNGTGIYLARRNIVKISNVAIENFTFGVYLSHSSNIFLSRNHIKSSFHGIRIETSSSNFILRNYIESNKYGITFFSASNQNSILGNTIKENENFGILFHNSTENYVIHNNYVGNKDHIFVYDSSNFWDNGLEGNCWSGYNGTDSNYDGIGDTPYDVGANNRDNYPLMGKFSTFETNQTKNINIISNSTIKTFTYTEYDKTIKIHVSNSTPLQTFGFCRITIPHSLMSNPSNVTVDGASPTYWNYTLHDNGTHRWLYFTYRHSTVEIVISASEPVNTLPMFAVIAIPLILLFAAILILRRRHGVE